MPSGLANAKIDLYRLQRPDPKLPSIQQAENLTAMQTGS